MAGIQVVVFLLLSGRNRCGFCHRVLFIELPFFFCRLLTVNSISISFLFLFYLSCFLFDIVAINVDCNRRNLICLADAIISSCHWKPFISFNLFQVILSFLFFFFGFSFSPLLIGIEVHVATKRGLHREKSK